MKKGLNKWLFLPILFVTLITSCGGSSGGSSGGSEDVSALQIASQLSIVDAQDVEAGANINLRSMVFRAVPTTGAYITDPLDKWVHDESMEALEIVNEIMCTVDQTEYPSFVNAGAYIALISKTDCSRGDSKSGQQGNQSTGANQESYEKLVANVTRASDSDPQLIYFWIEQAATEMEPAMIITGKFTVTEGVSDDNPFGSFHMDFRMMDAATQKTQYAHGYLETVDEDDQVAAIFDDQVELMFYMTSDSALFPINESVHVVMKPDSSEGYAYTTHEFDFEGFDESGIFNIAFNELYYQSEKDGEDAECLDRINYENHVFRYGVYSENGSRLTLETPGFGIKYNNNSQMEWGWAGYYGIWLPEEITVVSGMTLVRADRGENSGTEYTTIVAPGKLIKHTKKAYTLSDFENTPLNLNDPEGEFKVIWNSEDLFKTHSGEQGQNGMTWTELEAPVEIDIQANQHMWFWRDGVGGLSIITGEPAVINGDTEVIADIEEILTPASDLFAGGDLTLYCYSQCPRANITSAQFNNNDQDAKYLEDRNDQINNPHEYTFDVDTMTLMYGGEPVKLEDGVTASDENPNQWGIMSGAMLTSTEGLTQAHDIWNEDVYYTWETGPNNWNKFTGLVDGDGNGVSFTKPIALDYTHTDGAKYILEYAGSGELHGIPWEEDDDADSDRWYPTFTIPDGSEATDSSTETTYYIRAREMEQELIVTDDDNCSGFEDVDLEAPPESRYTSPDNDAMPTVTDDPKVIGGEIQGS